MSTPKKPKFFTERTRIMERLEEGSTRLVAECWSFPRAEEFTKRINAYPNLVALEEITGALCRIVEDEFPEDTDERGIAVEARSLLARLPKEGES